MPTYEYECTKCGKVVEIFQSITEPARKRLRKSDPKPCKCDAPVQRRIGTGGGIIFKGSGFYLTDYRSEGYKKAQKAESEASTGKTSEGKSSDAKSDTKPEKKAEPKTESGGDAKKSKKPKAAVSATD
jgi:putative FmdB family regulatory protein